jgi:hypothetical protein
VSREAEPRDTHSQAEPGNEKNEKTRKSEKKREKQVFSRDFSPEKLEELGKNKT